MRLPFVTLAVWLLACGAAPLFRGDDPPTESDDVLRDVIRRVVAEVEAEREGWQFSYGMSLARLLTLTGDKDAARELLLRELKAHEEEYKADAEAASKRGESATSSMFDLLQISKELHDSAFDDEARSLLSRVSETATSNEHVQIHEVVNLAKTQVEIGDRDGARATRDRTLRRIEAERAREQAKGNRMNPDDLAFFDLSPRSDENIAKLHVFAGEVKAAFEMLSSQIEAAEQLSNDRSKPVDRRTVDASPLWEAASRIAKETVQALAETMPAHEAKPHVDRVLEWSLRFPSSYLDTLNASLAPQLARIGRDVEAVRILRSLEVRSNEKPVDRRDNSRAIASREQWEARNRKYWLWEARFTGWMALGYARKQRKEPGRALEALAEVERLLHDPAPHPGIVPTLTELEEDAQRPPGTAPRTDPEPKYDPDSVHSFIQIRLAADLIAELGERDRALAVIDLLGPNSRFRGLATVARAFEKSGQTDSGAELRRQALESAVHTLEKLDATPIPEPKPAPPIQGTVPRLEVGVGRPAGSLTPVPPPPPFMRDDGLTPQERRENERSRILYVMADLQASLGDFEAAAETTRAIPVESERLSSQCNVMYEMSRKGRVTEALQRAMALDAPEPRLGALVKVAEACEWVMQDRKEKNGK